MIVIITMAPLTVLLMLHLIINSACNVQHLFVAPALLLLILISSVLALSI